MRSKRQPSTTPQTSSSDDGVNLTSRRAVSQVPNATGREQSAFASINEVPTSASWADDVNPCNSLARPYEVQTPARYRQPLTGGGDFMANTTGFSNSSAVKGVLSSVKSLASSSRSLTVNVLRESTQPVAVPESLRPTAAVQEKQSCNATSQRTNHSTSKLKRNAKKEMRLNRDFQHSEDFASVKVQWVNVSQRSAFELNQPISLREWRRIADEAAKINPRKNMHKRLSPSYQHLQILHAMQSMKSVRQLHFSASTGIDSEFFRTNKAGLMELLEKEGNEKYPESNKDLGSVDQIRFRRRRIRRDGCYRSIHPIQAFMTVIPDNTESPHLNHKKHRLPTRSDVGFPNASEDEVKMKQKEIQWESIWEETSPRIVLVVTSDDLGAAVMEDDISISSSKKDADPVRFNGVGFPGMPFAGRELLLAKARNDFFFGNSTNHRKVNESFVPNLGKSALQPNPNSILAPPLEATFSESQGWRPRVFHDRPAGMSYILACPLAVSLENAEKKSPPIPLLGSLTLYKLPTSGRVAIDAKDHGYGKISEAFWFPIGDWKDQVPLSFLDGNRKNLANDLPSSVDDLLADWLNRKRKAIYSFNSSDFHSNEQGSMFVVLEVYELLHKSLRDPNEKEDKIAAKGEFTNGFETNSCSNDANKTFDVFSPHLLIPKCFGIGAVLSFPECKGLFETPYIVTVDENEAPTNPLIWPKGKTKQFQLFSSSKDVLSQEKFVERLCDIVNIQDSSLHSVESHVSLSTNTEEPIVFDGNEIPATSSTSQSAKGIRKLGSRLFRSAHTAPKARISVFSEERETLHVEVDTEIRQEVVVGQATIFYSSLMSDFLQSLLASPCELSENDDLVGSNQKNLEGSPALLVDVSGDFAVLLERRRRHDDTAMHTETDVQCKTSDLLRLPASLQRVGYAGAGEFREILYTPIQPEKQYDVEVQDSCHSLLNLLYIYPRLLRILENGGKASAHSYQSNRGFTLRLRTLKKEHIPEESKRNLMAGATPIKSFHNCAPWAGPGLIDSFYTSVVAGISAGRSSVSMRDEAKLSLPSVLDGSYSLEFSLFEVATSAEIPVSTLPVAQATIPLSSSASREIVVGTRVATVIPNGKHRLELGPFQLQFETRLVSSLHLGDPAIATILRDFPLPESEHLVDTHDELRPVTPLALAASLNSSMDFEKSIPALLSTASESCVLRHFPILAYLHLCNLVNKHQGMLAKSRTPLSAALRSTFDLIGKVKSKLRSSSSDGQCSIRYDLYFKKFFDTFDETSLSSPLQAMPDQYAMKPEGTDRTTDSFPVDNSSSQDDEKSTGDRNEKESGDSIFRPRSSSTQAKLQRKRAPQIVNAAGPSGVPFSRVPYGASKIDRMRVEAERSFDNQHFAQYFDDDETVATSPSLLNWSARRQDTVEQSLDDDASFVPAVSGQSLNPDENFRQSTRSDFAKRVKIVAEVMLAPCVGPSLSSIIATGSTFNPKKETRERREKFETSSNEFQNNNPPDTSLCYAGSDDEDETSVVKTTSHFDGQHSTDCFLRGVSDIHVLSLTVEVYGNDSICVSHGEHLYESIIVLWLKSYSDFGGGSFTPSLGRFNLRQHLRLIPMPHEEEVRYCKMGLNNDACFLFTHMDFFLPLCLKSIILRCCEATKSLTGKVWLDEIHLDVLKLFVEMLAYGLLGQALAGDTSDRKRAIIRSLSGSKYASDFLIGIAAILHPEQTRIIFGAYLHAFRKGEAEQLGEAASEMNFQWTEEIMHLVRSARQLSLSAIERLAVLPSFVPINFPLKYGQRGNKPISLATDWLHQHIEIPTVTKFDLRPVSADGRERLPKAGWLAELLLNECLSICSLSCQTVVSEAIAQIELSNRSTSYSRGVTPSRTTPDDGLKRDDLLMFQSIGVHAISIVYELIVRRHSMDRRYQNESCLGRIAALFVGPILQSSVESVRWLARMEATHKVRSIWLLCFLYVLQEAPDTNIREFIRSCCEPKDTRMHRFIRVLRLCSSTFQSFAVGSNQSRIPAPFDTKIATWLLQECFNTVCATINIVVDETRNYSMNCPEEKKKMMHSVLDLLLYVLTIPQSPVTHLRAMGISLHALEEFGVSHFLDVTSGSLQHWARVILSLMNSISLSVRAVAVDFVVSLIGSSYDLQGNVDSILVIFASVLPEVAAREVALYSVSGHISSFEDISKSLWPIRRSIADLGDSNPIDDDRVDPQLVPILSFFCRACQAIIDGTLVEMRLRGNHLIVAGCEIKFSDPETAVFDSDEESLFEAATFFVPENATIQRLRWLLTLKSLHESNEQWIEAAETLFVCAHTITDSMQHFKSLWRPERFILWSDPERAMWLESVGEDQGHPDRGNAAVMEFAGGFLEPSQICGSQWNPAASKTREQLTISKMSSVLEIVVAEGVRCYSKEIGTEELAYGRLESLLKVLMAVMGDYKYQISGRALFPGVGNASRIRHAEDHASLRKVVTSISGNMAELAERLLESAKTAALATNNMVNTFKPMSVTYPIERPLYLVMRVYGVKPRRFMESTTLPAFLEWEKPCICRVPKSIVERAKASSKPFYNSVCEQFAAPFLTALKKECGKENVVLRTDDSIGAHQAETVTVIDVFTAETVYTDAHNDLSPASYLQCKHFLQKSDSALLEHTVARDFPCTLSRQRSMMTTKILTTNRMTLG